MCSCVHLLFYFLRFRLLFLFKIFYATNFWLIYYCIFFPCIRSNFLEGHRRVKKKYMRQRSNKRWDKLTFSAFLKVGSNKQTNVGIYGLCLLGNVPYFSLSCTTETGTLATWTGTWTLKKMCIKYYWRNFKILKKNHDLSREIIISCFKKLFKRFARETVCFLKNYEKISKCEF